MISKAPSLVADTHSQVSRAPSTTTAIKRRILERINQMDEKELLNVGKELDVNLQEVDRASIITQEKLRKFNDYFGYENGPATKDEVDEGGSVDEDDGQAENPNEGLNEEQKDEVRSLAESLARSRSALAGRAHIANKLSRTALSKANSQINDL